MNYILMAVPMFLILILIEFLWDQYKQAGTYRLNDTINSITMGIMSRISGILYAAIPFSAYAYLYEDYGLFTWDTTSYLTWILAFVLYDLSYYWNHRMGHTLNISWASHVVHHSSEEYNLSTALRQTSVPNIIGWIFYLPIAFLGFPPVVLATVGALNLLYQFWVHTQHINKMPNWYEAIFVTPSNHRVHHGKNKVYIDKNHGGVFILWDRIFGTFQKELEHEKVIFGISTQLGTWNPIWGNVHFLTSLIKDAWKTKSWVDKLTLWFRPTGYRPQDMEENFPVIKSNKAVEKYETTSNSFIKFYIFSQFVFTLSICFAYLHMASNLNLIQQGIGFSILAYSLLSLSFIQEGKPYVFFSESIKFIGLLLTAQFIILTDNASYLIILFTAITSLIFLFFANTQDKQEITALKP